MGMTLARVRALVPESQTWRRRIVVGLVFVAATLVMFRPSPGSVTSTLPGNVVDPSLNTWALMWGNHALLHQPRAFFDANIYWPHEDAIAYSEVILPVVPVFGLVHLVTGNQLTAMNVSTLLLVLLCLVTTYCLARRFTTHPGAAVFAAFAYSFNGFVFMHIFHIQLMTLGLIPLAILLLLRVLEDRRLLDAVLLGVASAALVSGALYYGLIFTVCVAVLVGGHLVAVRFRPGVRFVRCMAVTGVVAGVLLAPTALAYLDLQQEQDFTRPLVNEYGLNPVDVVAPAPGSYLYKPLADANLRRPSPYEHAFFPGFSTIALAVVGLVVVVRWRSGSRSRRRELILLVAMAVVTVALAAGPTVFGHPSLFRLFYYHVPAFDGVRATARLAVPALLVGALLAAVGLDALLRRLSGRTAMLVAAGAGAFLLLELAVPVPKERLDVSPQAMAVYDELRERPDGIVAELPIIDPTTQPDEWGYVEGPRMARATTDWKPRVNGYSGAWPDDYVSILQVLNRFPSASALDRMDDLGVRYVVLHVGPAHFFPQLTEAQAQRIVDNLPEGASAERVGEAWLVDLGPSPQRDAAGRSRD